MAKLLWKPTESQIKKTNMYRFMNFINETFQIFGRPSGNLPTSSTPNRMIRL
jgi:hypothetical protein